MKKFFNWLGKESETGGIEWFVKKIIFAVIHIRVPNGLGVPGLWQFLTAIPYRHQLAIKARRGLLEHGQKSAKSMREAKILYASPVGAYGKPLLVKTIKQFSNMNVDYIIFAYDETTFDEPIFKNCKIVRERGLKWQFMKKYLTPEYCEAYDFIMPWDDDLDILSFDLESFLKIMTCHALEVAQPALTKDSHHTHCMTLKRGRSVGRLTDAVEIMAQVFCCDAWARYWKIVEPDWNYWGWGYDLLGNDLCGFMRTGVIDSQSVYHTKHARFNYTARSELRKFRAKYPQAKKARFVSIGKLS